MDTTGDACQVEVEEEKVEETQDAEPEEGLWDKTLVTFEKSKQFLLDAK